VIAQRLAGEALQNDAEPSGGDVERAGLEPDAIGIENPPTAIFQVDVGNEVFVASSIRIWNVGTNC
jgi:hypothetical protein